MTPFHDLLGTAATAFGDSPAIRIDDSILTYAELLDQTERLASGLHGQGAGDRIAIIMENSRETVLVWLAISILGCADVPINPQYRGALLRYLLGDCEATVVICDAAFAPALAEIAAGLPALRLVVVNGPHVAVFPEAVRVIGLDECQAPTVQLPSPSADERVILYTSGTTGPSKGVVHSQRSCLTLARYNARMLEYDRSDRLLNFFPLYHQNARYTGVIPALAVGASIRLERRFSSSTFWSTCDTDGITAFNYLGSVLRLILNVTPPERKAGTHSLRKAFGAGAQPGIWSEFEDRLGIRLIETFGLTEAPMATVNVRGEDASPVGSAGRASELFDVAVVDEHDRPQPAGQIGEIVLRPRVPDAMMSGYLNKAEATVASFRNLWFHSGDRGRLAADGSLYFEERGKDSIRRRGENISAWEVEAVLNAHGGVAEAAVYGLPSDEFDEEVCAALVLRGPEAVIDEIVAHARANLPGYAVPTILRILPTLPRTPTAKVQKGELRRAGCEGAIRIKPAQAARRRT